MERAVILPKRRVTPPRVAAVLGLGTFLLCVAAGRGWHSPCAHKISKATIARISVRKFVYEALPLWQHEHQAVCPSDIAQLTPYMNSDDVLDPWGHRYVLVCDAFHERAVVFSHGPGDDVDDEGYDGIIASN